MRKIYISINTTVQVFFFNFQRTTENLNKENAEYNFSLNDVYDSNPREQKVDVIGAKENLKLLVSNKLKISYT